MKLIELLNPLNNSIIESYLYSENLLIKFKTCPKCSNKNFGVVRRNKLKCYRCKFEWSKKYDGPLERIHIDINKIALAKKLKSLGVSDRNIITECKLNWNSYKRLLVAIT